MANVSGHIQRSPNGWLGVWRSTDSRQERLGEPLADMGRELE
jgi:hypothetical protein